MHMNIDSQLLLTPLLTSFLAVVLLATSDSFRIKLLTLIFTEMTFNCYIYNVSNPPLPKISRIFLCHITLTLSGVLLPAPNILIHLLQVPFVSYLEQQPTFKRRKLKIYSKSYTNINTKYGMSYFLQVCIGERASRVNN